ncbi:MAG: hypothetical protein JO077_13580 [Verrucomicrobia bacterium]|nr:hypothetical protein [Verrucomicrobiota bacterium]
MKQAFLATVLSIENRLSDGVVIRFECDELTKNSELVSTGLNGEHSHTSRESVIEVMCRGNPKAKVGDKVPIIINLPR